MNKLYCPEDISKQMNRKFTLIDLFAGAGGFSLGFDMAGFKTVAAFEVDHWACETLGYNFPDTVIVETDIRVFSDREISLWEHPDVLIGGPPCQGFSVAGSTQFGVEDPRNALFKKFLHFAELLRPYICIIENVPGIATKTIDGTTTIPNVVANTLSRFGYTTRTFELNAADFGVPQLRRRTFIVSVADQITWVPPTPTHSSSSNQRTDRLFNDELLSPVTVWDAISDLPQINAGEGSDDLVTYHSDTHNNYQALMREQSSGVINHIAMRHTQRLIERFKTIACGQSLKDVSDQHGQKKNFTGEINEKPYKYNNYRLNPSSPSLAVPASFQSSFVHPFLHRNLTAREAARLMSFPDRFHFKGKRTAMSWESGLSQYNQIGNAVCPLVARALAESCLAALTLSHVPERQMRSISQKGMRLNHSETKQNALFCTLQIPSEMRDRFTNVGLSLFSNKADRISDSNTVKIDGFDLPVYLIPLALLFTTEPNCTLCDPSHAPFGSHNGQIAFLISKEDFDTLASKHKDHGLDYHLRALSGIQHQCAHFIGRILEDLGLGKVSEVINPRTGRLVQGLTVETCPRTVDALRATLHAFISNNVLKDIQSHQILLNRQVDLCQG